MGTASIATQRSDADNNYVAPHIRAYDILITRATDFLAVKDIDSSQRVARLLLRSPGLCRAHQMTCYEILSHRHRYENEVYHTAQAMTVQSFGPGAVKVVIIPPHSSRHSTATQPSNTPLASIKSAMPSKPSMKRTPRTTSIKKDDIWITSPTKPPTRAPKTVKRVTFAEPFKPFKDTIKENMKKSKVGKLFPELKAKFGGHRLLNWRVRWKIRAVRWHEMKL